MLIKCLIVAGLLAFVATAIVPIAKSSLADRRLRRGWLLYAGTVFGVAILEVYLFFFGSDVSAMLNEDLVPLLLSLILVGHVFLLKKTFSYLSEVTSVKGTNIYDPVTQVFNRIYLEQRLDTEVARCHRYGSPLAVVVVEIRKFIQLNDEYGHQVSAIATTRLAKRLISLLRETDVVASFSAGKFALVLPDTPEGSLPGLVNRLRSAIDGLVVVDGAGIENSVRINVVFGTGCCELDTRNGKELMHKAILALEGAQASIGRTNDSLVMEDLYTGAYNESN